MSHNSIEPDVTAGPLISSAKVDGTQVYGSDGETLGSIDCLMIDKQSGHVRYAVLELGGFPGMTMERYPLPWQQLRYDTEKDGFVVPLAKERLQDAPRHPPAEVQPCTREYFGTVDRYYGI